LSVMKARTAEGRPRLITPPFLLVMMANLAYFMSVGAMQPVVPRFVKGPLASGEVAVGLTIGIFSLAAVILRPWAGRLGDRKGRRLLLTAGGFVIAASLIGYVPANSLGLLLAFRFLSGVGEAFFYVGAASVINDLAPEERRGEALSYFSLSLFGGLALGPVMGEVVLEAAGFDAAWLAAAACAALAGTVGFWVPETRPEGAADNAKGQLVHRAALMPGAVLAANIFGLATFVTFVTLYSLELGMSGGRYVFAFHAVLLLLIRSFGARIPDVVGPARSARIALACAAVGMATIGIWSTVPGLFAGVFIWSVGHSLAFPALMTMAIRNAPASERGAVVGTFTAFFDLSFGIGSVSAGTIAAFLGYEGAFVFAGGVAGVGLVLLLARARIRDRARARGELEHHGVGDGSEVGVVVRKP
jgi:MFS family permease